MQRARSLFCQRRSLFESGVRILGSGIRLGLRSSNLSRGVGDFFFCGGIHLGLRLDNLERGGGGVGDFFSFFFLIITKDSMRILREFALE